MENFKHRDLFNDTHFWPFWEFHVSSWGLTAPKRATWARSFLEPRDLENKDSDIFKPAA